MSDELNYIEKNKKLWNSKTDYHLTSEFYNVEAFLKGKNSLNDIELNLLNTIQNKNILHLQCHFGQDTLSLVRLGASVTGVDLSDNAIKNANLLAKQTNLSAEFICCDLYSLPQHLDKKFDIVFTSYGTIGWLPDIDKWANIVSRYLKPNGKFVFVDFHPIVWMYDNAFEKITYNYFNDGPIIETEEGTYADKTAPIKLESIGWNHAMSEVVNALIKNGLSIKSMQEFNYSPYNCFNGMEEFEPGKFCIASLGNKMPMVYAIEAIKM